MRSWLLIAIVLLFCASQLQAQYALLNEFSIFQGGDDVRNLLDPETMAIDTWRGEIFIASASQPRITAVSAYTRKARYTVTAGDGLPTPMKLLACDPKNRRLLCTGREDFPRTAALTAYDPLVGAIAVQVGLGPCNRLQIIPDTKRGVLYVTTGREHILVLGLESLAIQDSMVFEAPCGGLAFDSLNSELYAAQALPVRGISTIKTYNTANRERLSTIQFAASEPVDRLECDPFSGNIIAFSAGGAYAFDAFGQMTYQYGINDGVAATTASDLYRRAYVSDVRGARANGRPGTHGRMHMLGFEGKEIDSLEFNFPVSAIGVHEPTLTLAVLSPAEGTLYFFNLPDYRPMEDVLLGKRVESGAVLDSISRYGRGVLTNPAHPAGGYVAWDVSQGRTEEFGTGFLPVDAAPLNAGKAYAVLSQGEGSLYIHDYFGGITGTIPTGAYAGVSDKLPMIVASRDGLDHVLAAFPEFGTFAMFDAASQVLISAGFVEGFPAITGSGKGLIQPCFVPGGSEVCLLLPGDRLLQVYDRTTMDFKNQIDLGAFDWDAVVPFERFCLQPGPDDGTVFVGPYLVTTDGSAEPALATRKHSIVLAHLQNNITGQLSNEGEKMLFRLMDGTTEVEEVSLPPDLPLSDIFASHDGALYVFTSNKDARVAYISLESPSNVAEVPCTVSAGLHLYPNPASLEGSLVFATAAGRYEGPAVFSISDLAGRNTVTRRIQVSAGQAVIPVRSIISDPGIYVFRVIWAGNSVSSLVIVK